MTEVEMRREPVQARSRRRVDKILDQARRQIADHGTEKFKMNSLARASEMPIATLYQYFPNKSSVISKLTEQYLSDISNLVAATLEPVGTKEEFREAMSQLLESLYQMIKQEPVFREIWAGVQADPTIRSLNLTDSKRNADLIHQKLCAISCLGDRDQARKRVLLITHLTGSAIRMICELDTQEGQMVFQEWREIALDVLDL